MASRVTFYQRCKGRKNKQLAEVRNAPLPPVGTEVLLTDGDVDTRYRVVSASYVVREFSVEVDDKWHAEVSVILELMEK